MIAVFTPIVNRMAFILLVICIRIASCDTINNYCKMKCYYTLFLISFSLFPSIIDEDGTSNTTPVTMENIDNFHYKYCILSVQTEETVQAGCHESTLDTISGWDTMICTLHLL